mmetsp:Transcript_53421/g.159450  ORF Transcript_53421/g.159450 Transcript_53421/m.159450 type:complete len:317 (-) Transcript_53421:1-951(-)
MGHTSHGVEEGVHRALAAGDVELQHCLPRLNVKDLLEGCRRHLRDALLDLEFGGRGGERLAAAETGHDQVCLLVDGVAVHELHLHQVHDRDRPLHIDAPDDKALDLHAVLPVPGEDLEQLPRLRALDLQHLLEEPPELWVRLLCPVHGPRHVVAPEDVAERVDVKIPLHHVALQSLSVVVVDCLQCDLKEHSQGQVQDQEGREKDVGDEGRAHRQAHLLEDVNQEVPVDAAGDRHKAGQHRAGDGSEVPDDLCSGIRTGGQGKVAHLRHGDERERVGRDHRDDARPEEAPQGRAHQLYQQAELHGGLQDPRELQHP